MTGFRLHDGNYLWWLMLLPMIFITFKLTIRWGQSRLATFAHRKSLDSLILGKSDTAFGQRTVLLVIGLALVIFSLSRPQGNPQPEIREMSGLDVVVLLDVSLSMNAEDVYPSRLLRAKKSIQYLMDQLSGDRIGVVAFAGSSVVAVPLTSDYETANLFLDSVDTDLIQNQGTDLAHAIQVAMNALVRGGAGQVDNQKNRLVIVMSDGELHDGDWKKAVTEATEQGASFYTMALGTERGAPIPIRDSRGELVGHKRDKQGNTIVTKTDDSVLRDIAKTGNGVFYFSTVDGREIDDVLLRSKNIDRSKTGGGTVLVYKEYFQYFLGLGLLFIIMSYLLQYVRLGGKNLLLILLAMHSSNAIADSVFYSNEKNKSDLAEKLLLSDKSNEAAQIYRELQVDKPNAPELNYNLGAALGKGSEKEEARRLLTSPNLKNTPLEYMGKLSAAGTFVEEKNNMAAKIALAELIQELSKKESRNQSEEKTLIEAKKRMEHLAQSESGNKGDKQQSQDQKQQQSDKKNESGSDGNGEKKKDDQAKEEKNESSKKNDQQSSPEQEAERKKQEANRRNPIQDAEAERILETLNNDESKIQKKFLKKKIEKGNVDDNDKDW